MKKGLLIFTVVGIAAQFGVMASILIKRELTLRRGEVYRFATAPVDPFDAFRGRYVELRFDVERSGANFSEGVKPRKPCYALLGVDTNGFASVEAVYAKNPGNHLPVLKVRARYNNRIYLPFDRYYMPEKLAPEAEEAYLKFNRGRGRDEQPAAAVVRVWRGNAVIEDLEIDSVPVVEYLKQNQSK